ncbi:hypothetical protein [Cesiribacter andamanensis]|uniref:Secreted protein n=1 Tax=Cesiribacter andamanensis AMV16 TaxID=1279009 RepID=M7N6T4_9BACT|nr:hypothetical protein [Cesiribacter andamanensis]EMR04303.1 hypothetical protein ADICEAN_00589 [Cesiribacter andamanensis AMV16]
MRSPALYRFAILIVFVLAGQQLAAQSPFLEKMRTLCGNSYGGRVVFPEGGADPFSGQALSIHVTSCKAREIRIPFHVGADRSRTWVLTQLPEGLQLKHDHRHEDGTPDEITMYGGMANAAGTPWVQYFPADAHTAALIPAAATNEWSLQLSQDGKTLSYILKRDGALRFRADFDLTTTLH